MSGPTNTNDWLCRCYPVAVAGMVNDAMREMRREQCAIHGAPPVVSGPDDGSIYSPEARGYMRRYIADQRQFERDDSGSGPDPTNTDEREHQHRWFDSKSGRVCVTCRARPAQDCGPAGSDTGEATSDRTQGSGTNRRPGGEPSSSQRGRPPSDSVPSAADLDRWQQLADIGNRRTLYNVNSFGDYSRDHDAEAMVEAFPSVVAEVVVLRERADTAEAERDTARRFRRASEMNWAAEFDKVSARLSAAEAAIQRVREVHFAWHYDYDLQRWTEGETDRLDATTYCRVCTGGKWPCPTIRALDAALPAQHKETHHGQ